MPNEATAAPRRPSLRERPWPAEYPMPRHYFDIQDGEVLQEDLEGVDCPDLERARREGLRTLGQLVTEALPDGDRGKREFVVTIKDHNRKPVFTAKLSLSVERHR
jgi:hypothetical protein